MLNNLLGLVVVLEIWLALVATFSESTQKQALSETDF